MIHWRDGDPCQSRMATGTTPDDYREAPYSWTGPLADTWKDKPHVLVYDLAGEVLYLQHERRALEAEGLQRNAEIARLGEKNKTLDAAMSDWRTSAVDVMTAIDVYLASRSGDRQDPGLNGLRKVLSTHRRR